MCKHNSALATPVFCLFISKCIQTSESVHIYCEIIRSDKLDHYYNYCITAAAVAGTTAGTTTAATTTITTTAPATITAVTTITTPATTTTTTTTSAAITL